MTNTQDNLKEAFAGESQANQKYRAFAKKAEQEGLPNIELRALDGIGSTTENLQVAIDGETYEYTEMYPPMLEQAEADAHKAKRIFAYAVKSEQVHARLYKLALEAVQRGEDLAETKFYLCPICGQIEFGSPPEPCPICGAKSSKFIQV